MTGLFGQLASECERICWGGGESTTHTRTHTDTPRTTGRVSQQKVPSGRKAALRHVVSNAVVFVCILLEIEQRVHVSITSVVSLASFPKLCL